MTEVSAWNAVDASNNALAPDGWPEGQMPATVNDCGRMMMGALRREHDLVTAKIGSTAGSINTFSINATGGITGAQLTSTGNASVAGTLSASNISAGFGVTCVNLSASGGLSVTGNANVGGGVTVAGTVTAPYLSGLLLGGAGNAGTLECYGTPNAVAFRWDSSASRLHYRIDNIFESGPLAMTRDIDELKRVIQQLAARVEELETRGGTHV